MFIDQHVLHLSFETIFKHGGYSCTLLGYIYKKLWQWLSRLIVVVEFFEWRGDLLHSASFTSFCTHCAHHTSQPCHSRILLLNLTSKQSIQWFCSHCVRKKLFDWFLCFNTCMCWLKFGLNNFIYKDFSLKCSNILCKVKCEHLSEVFDKTVWTQYI